MRKKRVAKLESRRPKKEIHIPTLCEIYDLPPDDPECICKKKREEERRRKGVIATLGDIFKDGEICSGYK